MNRRNSLKVTVLYIGIDIVYLYFQKRIPFWQTRIDL
jgi:hypothetical protein